MTSEQIPEIFANRYKIIEKLGAGGMGCVYLACDSVLNINVAIKVLAFDPTGRTAARLQREAMAAGKLTHPNIAKVFDFGQTAEGSPYMVMEYVQGESLSDLISKRGHLSIKEATDIFVQILQGLSVAHSHKIIHRDLKPSNIMVASLASNEHQVKLLDFGIARLEAYSQELTSAGALLGSPIYMSPEQAQGDEADARSDIYSFGCLMFESLSGRPPFIGDTAFETISMHKTKAPPLVNEVASDLEISQELVNLIDSCLSKSPEARPQNCNDLLVKLKSESVPEIQVQEALPEVQMMEPKTVLGNSPLVIAISAILLLALTAFAFVMINASIKTSINERENMLMAKVDSSQTNNTGFGGEHGKMFIAGMGSLQKKSKDGSSTIKVSVPLDDDDLVSLIRDKKYVDFGDLNLTRQQLMKLTSLPLESLLLRGQEVDDETVRLICKMKTLKILYCKNTLLTNKGLRSLNNLTRLEVLRLGCPLVTSDGLAHLSGLTNLTRLELTGDRLSDETPLFLSKLQKLISFTIKSNSFTDKGFAELKRLPRLQTLSVSSPLVTDRSLSLLTEMKSLQTANFENCSFSKDFGLKLKPGKKLSGLSLVGQRFFSVLSAEALAKTNIGILNLQGSSIFDPQLIAIAKMKNLSVLNLGGTQVTIKGISALKSPPLVSLSFKNYLNLDDEIVRKISQLKELRSLELGHTNINDKQLIMLAVLSKLENLNLTGCPGLSFEGVDQFQNAFMSQNHRRCPIRKSMVLARDVQETENFEKGKKDWRVKFGESD